MRVVWMAIGLLAGCGGWGTPECADDGDCTGSSVCDERSLHCKEVDCTSSASCALGTHCDPAENTCVGGCGDDDDCVAGEICTFDHQCEPYGCRTTELDCHYGENCISGACQDDPDPHCLKNTNTTTQTTCLNAGGTLACFGTCPNITTNVYCLLPCNASQSEACPRGTVCVQPFDPSDDPGFYCSGDCAFLNANGF